MVVGPMAAVGRGEVTSEQVQQAIRDGVRFLKGEQRPDGSWPEYNPRYATGTTSLATLALLTAGVPKNDPSIVAALRHLEQFSARQLGQVYTVALQTMVYAAADPDRYRIRLKENVEWLEAAQIGPRDGVDGVGGWTYTVQKGQSADNSNTQYALLGLNAAAEVGVPVDPDVWELARHYWEQSQRLNGGWGYTMAPNNQTTGSMTTAGISSLVITGLRRIQSRELLVGDEIRNCGEGGINPNIQRALDWMGANFRVDTNLGRGITWKYYYLYGLERAGRLSGQRYFGSHDWYVEGAEELVHLQDRLLGSWPRNAGEDSPVLTTSFALLFLAKGRAPVLINKLRHGVGDNWDIHREGVRNLVDAVSADWKTLLTWQVVNPDVASVEAMLQAPICFLNYHEPIGLGEDGKRNLRSYVEQGGFLFAEACCGSREHDRGFRALVAEIFPPDQGYELKPLSEDHPVYRSRHRLSPESAPLFGIDLGCRTVLIYSPNDLSGYWNFMPSQPDNAAVLRATRIGENVVDYATGREPPPDKLVPREVVDFQLELPRRGALQIAKLRHAGGWNVAPLAIPNLTTVLRQRIGYDVVINHRELLPTDPNLINFPLIYIHGNAAFSLSDADMEALRSHLDPGGGTFFADAACGSPAFDTAFRRFIAELLPDHELEVIPPDDELYTARVGFDLSDVQYTKAAGGDTARPRLEGVKIDGHWAVIYSPYDIGCALERQQGLDCKGYTHESAMRIAANVVIYATLP
ncbi:DUF4159 domain-containing protein [Tautonia sociabilis]|uniref:DUF4159 domain-containing protein n=2 Tax=Tautonia sociabilis TaxID=2080755 RepID=A0A432MCX5_9BACT|nr:DUF4159 domain-containing protein [Tautonia sociabilis]